MHTSRPVARSAARAVAVLSAVLLSAGLLTGCGGDEPASSAGSSTPPSTPPTTVPPTTTPTASTAPPTPPATGTPPPKPTKPRTPPPVDASPPSGSRTVTVSGRVQRGVEPGCLVLVAGRVKYTLLRGPAGARSLYPGAQVEVTGRLDDDAVTYCQEGRVLRVISVRDRRGR